MVLKVKPRLGEHITAKSLPVNSHVISAEPALVNDIFIVYIQTGVDVMRIESASKTA